MIGNLQICTLLKLKFEYKFDFLKMFTVDVSFSPPLQHNLHFNKTQSWASHLVYL
eukprot:UN18239